MARHRYSPARYYGLSLGIVVGCFCILAASPLHAAPGKSDEHDKTAQTRAENTTAVRLTDQTGQQLVLKKPAHRVIIIPIPMASMMMAIDGGTDKIAGMNAAAKSDLTEGLLGKMFPAAHRIPTNIAGETFAPGAEAMAAAKPDLVVQWGDRGEAIITPIRALGLPVLGMRYGDTLWVADWLRLLGQATGRSGRADRLADDFMRRMTDIAQEAARLPKTEKPSAVYLSRARSGIVAAGKGSSMDGDIRRVGGMNPAANLPAFAPIDVEQLLAWNPDVVLLNNFEPGLTPEVFYGDPRLKSLKAVKTRRVYLFPRGGFRWDPPSQESALSAEWLFAVLHPAKVKQAGDLRKNMLATYRDLYGYALSEAEIDGILRLAPNGGSAHYRELFAPR